MSILMLLLILSILYHPVMIYISLSLWVDVYVLFHRPYRKFSIGLVIASVISMVLVDASAAWNVKWTLLIEANRHKKLVPLQMHCLYDFQITFSFI